MALNGTGNRKKEKSHMNYNLQRGGIVAFKTVPEKGIIRASVDALCRDETSQISRDPRTKLLLTRRENLARPYKHASNSAFAHL